MAQFSVKIISLTGSVLGENQQAISCPSCGKDVSPKAFDCPSCGHPLKKPKRGIFGKIFKYLFILFNIIMALWVFGGGNSAIEATNQLSGAEKVGGQIGTGLGIMALLVLWVIGDIILGFIVLLTRPKK